MVLTGGSMGIQILVARHQGAREWERMALASRTGRVALVSLGAVLTALVLGINTWGGWEPLMANREVQDLFTPFLAVRGWGFVPYALLMALEADWIGQAKTKPLLPLALTMAGINIVLDAYWVEGLWGGPKLGALGAAQASLIAETTGAPVSYTHLTLPTKRIV